MFISYEEVYLGEKDGRHNWKYKLTDSEFGTVLGDGVNFMITTIVILEYSKRNLNVAKNLALTFIWLHKQYPDYSHQYFVDNNKKYNPIFLQYEKDFQKYLQKYLTLV
jgi:hypothetical protein